MTDHTGRLSDLERRAEAIFCSMVSTRDPRTITGTADELFGEARTMAQAACTLAEILTEELAAMREQVVQRSARESIARGRARRAADLDPTSPMLRVFSRDGAQVDG